MSWILVSKKRFTLTPLPKMIPELTRKLTFGETPAVSPTKLHSIVSPLSVVTALTIPLLSDKISTRLVSKRKSI